MIEMKDKPSRTQKRQQNRSPSYIVYARVNPSIGEAMDAFIAKTKPTPSQTAVVELALEEFFSKHGVMPEAD